MVFTYKLPEYTYFLVEVFFEVKAIGLALFDLPEVIVKGFLGDFNNFGCFLECYALVLLDFSPLGNFLQYLFHSSIIFSLFFCLLKFLIDDRRMDSMQFDKEVIIGCEFFIKKQQLFKRIHPSKPKKFGIIRVIK